MKTVYLVTRPDERYVVAVFSTSRRARNFIEKVAGLSRIARACYEVEEYVLDPGGPDWKNMYLYFVRMSPEGSVLLTERMRVSAGVFGFGRGCGLDHRGNLYTTVAACNAQHAVKIAGERLRAFTAPGVPR